MKTRALATICCLVALSACLVRATEPPPKSLRVYLDAVRRGDFKTAYDRTQLAEISNSFGSGASLSYEHFAAFFARNPLRRFNVRNVARLNLRQFENPTAPGTPFFEVDVDMTYSDGTHRETFTIEGEIIGTVTVEPDRVLLRTTGESGTIDVDGVRTRLGKAQRYSGVSQPLYALLMLQGPHELRIGTNTIGFSTSPLRVRSGPATIEGGTGEFRYLRVG